MVSDINPKPLLAGLSYTRIVDSAHGSTSNVTQQESHYDTSNNNTSSNSSNNTGRHSNYKEIQIRGLLETLNPARKTDSAQPSDALFLDCELESFPPWELCFPV